MVKISTGNTARTPVAAISPHFTPDTDKYIITEVGIVLAFILVNKFANTNSFQELMTQNMAVATIPGFIIGNTIYMIPFNLEQPSTQAASSSSIGTSSIKLCIIKIVNGILNVV